MLIYSDNSFLFPISRYRIKSRLRKGWYQRLKVSQVDGETLLGSNNEEEEEGEERREMPRGKKRNGRIAGIINQISLLRGSGKRHSEDEEDHGL